MPVFIRNAVSWDCVKKLLKTHLFSKVFLFMIYYCNFSDIMYFWLDLFSSVHVVAL